MQHDAGIVATPSLRSAQYRRNPRERASDPQEPSCRRPDGTDLPGAPFTEADASDVRDRSPTPGRSRSAWRVISICVGRSARPMSPSGSGAIRVSFRASRRRAAGSTRAIAGQSRAKLRGPQTLLGSPSIEAQWRSADRCAQAWSPPSVASHPDKSASNDGEAPVPSNRGFARCQRARRQTAGLMFWFTWKKFVGS